MNKIVGIVSGKGGVGKTTLCANVAFALASKGKKVIAVDGDVSLKNLDILLGLSDSAVYDMSDVLNGRCELDRAIVKHPQYPFLDFLAAPQNAELTRAVADGFLRMCIELRSRYDFVLVDAPAGVGVWVRRIIDCCDRIIVVATPDLTSLRDAARVAELTRQCHDPDTRLVINRVNPSMINRGYLQSVDDMMDSVSLPLMGLIPTDDSIVIYSNAGKPVVGSRSICSAPFSNVAARLCGDYVPLDKYWRK